MVSLGIDIGGSGVKGALVDIKEGRLVSGRFRVPTPQPATPEALTHAVAEIARNFQYQGMSGITFPGIIRQGRTLSAANLDKSWIGMDAEKKFSVATGASVVLINDADAAGLAEAQFGAAKGVRGLVILATLGTGIGTALLHDGVLIPNSEFGHLKIRGKDAEQRAAARLREEKDLSWKKWSGLVAEFLLELEALLSPELFVLGGGVSRKAEKFVPYLEREVHTPIVPAQMQNDAGIIGAAWFAATRTAPDHS